MTPRLSDEILREAVEAVARNGGSRLKAAEELGLNINTFGKRLQLARGRGLKIIPPETQAKSAPSREKSSKFTVADLPDDELSAEEIIAFRLKVYDRKRKATDARKLIPLKLNEPGPIAITIFGDIHIDNDGCNWPQLQQDMAVVNKTDGMYCAAIGDLQDGWVGRLARKWADQSTTGKQAWKLVEWWLGEMKEKLLFVVEGNHDAWTTGVNKKSAVDWLMAYHPGISDSDGIRIELRLPHGDPVVINARHDFAGRSQYNPAHGPAKAALFGYRDDDVLVAGHTHVSGYQPLKNPATGKVAHAIRVASYKAIDDYSKERGFLDGNISEAVVVMIDPHEPDIRHKIWVEFSVTRAARVLRGLRAEWKARA